MGIIATTSQMIEKAKLARPMSLTAECKAGQVSCVLVSEKGFFYSGMSLKASCGIGFCAETSAMSQMINAGESRILKIISLSLADNIIMPPCGACRELMYEINRDNLYAEIVLSAERTLILRDIFPERWQDLWVNEHPVVSGV